RARLQLERPLRGAEPAEQLLAGLLPLPGVERRDPLAGPADAAAHGLPELLVVPVAGGHVELAALDLAVRGEQLVKLPGRPVPAGLRGARGAERLRRRVRAGQTAHVR